MIIVPDGWTADQIAPYQKYWDSYFSGEAGRRGRAKFVPGAVAKSYVQTKEPELKSAFDDWLARLVGRVTLGEAALKTLNADPMIREWKADPRRDRVAMLHYYHRSYFTAHDGTITEHGDGFTLTFADPDEPWQSHVAGRERIPLGDGHDVVVEVQKDHPARFTVGRTRNGYTYEPQP